MRLLQSCHLDDERMVGIIDDDIHSRQPDHLMKLVAALGNHSILGHEGALLDTLLFHALRQNPAYL